MLFIVKNVLEQSFIGCSEFGQRSLVGGAEAETHSTEDDRDSIFCRSWVVVNPHQAGHAYVNLAKTTALKRGRARSVHDHFGTSCVPISVHRYKLLRYMSRTVSEHRVIRLQYTYRSEYGQFRYIHFGTSSASLY